jgi:5-methylcytosine-specific restriction endonuclease McrA
VSDFAFKPDPKLPVSGGIGRKKPKGRRKAGAARWQEIREKKLGPCRVCAGVAANVQLHHLVPRAQLGADTEANLVPLCPICHDRVTRREPVACATLRVNLRDDEYAYACEKLGESLFEAYYPVRYERP